MADITSPIESMQIPSGIAWLVRKTNEDGFISTKSSVKQSVSQGGGSFRVCWQCNYDEYQYQYRVRRRYSPSYADSLGFYDAESTWEDWSEWKGNSLSGAKSSTERYASTPSMSLVAATDSISISYDFSKYDKHEYQVRVRAFNESSKTYSEWGYGELTIVYEPLAVVASAVRQANGDVVLSVETNWLRGGNRFLLMNLRRESQHANPEEWTTAISGVGQDFEVTIPAKAVGGAKIIYATMMFKTSDENDGNGFTAQSFSVSEQADDNTVKEPVIEFDETESHCRVYVTGGAYSDVVITAEWIDFFGVAHIENLNAEEYTSIDSGGGWTGKLEAPPFGIDITYRVSVTERFKLRSKSVIRTTTNRKCLSLQPIGKEWCVELDRDLSWSSDASPNVEVVMLVGMARPTARRGIGGARTFNASGSFTSPSTSGGDGEWLSKVEWLRRFNGEWMYRNPNGERAKVLITSVSDSTDTSGITTVSVSMTEVE